MMVTTSTQFSLGGCIEFAARNAAPGTVKTTVTVGGGCVRSRGFSFVLTWLSGRFTWVVLTSGRDTVGARVNRRIAIATTTQSKIGCRIIDVSACRRLPMVVDKMRRGEAVCKGKKKVETYVRDRCERVIWMMSLNAHAQDLSSEVNGNAMKTSETTTQLIFWSFLPSPFSTQLSINIMRIKKKTIHDYSNY